MALEVFVSTRGDLLPNPHYDPVLCLFYAIENSVPSECDDGKKLPHQAWGYILVKDQSNSGHDRLNGFNSGIQKEFVNSEMELFEALVRLCLLWDADIYVGYEIEMSSWGYVIERSKILGMNIAPLLLSLIHI